MGDDGKPRELHTELAIDAIDYSFQKEFKTKYTAEINKSNTIVNCPYFTTNMVALNQKIERDFNWLDSFVIYMGIEGDTQLFYREGANPVIIRKGETVLVPAVLKELYLEPKSAQSKLLEVYIR